MPWLVPLSDLCTCCMALEVQELEYDEFGMDRQYKVRMPDVDQGFECFIPLVCTDLDAWEGLQALAGSLGADSGRQRPRGGMRVLRCVRRRAGF